MDKSQTIANAAAVEMMKLLLTVSSNNSDFAREINQAAATGNTGKIKELISEFADEVLAAGLAEGIKTI